jgi:serine phosphatase RsbU (regulator of sigma subunit)
MVADPLVSSPTALAAAVDRLPDGVVLLDPAWTVCYANPAAARLLGAAGSELAGRQLWGALRQLNDTPLQTFLLRARNSAGPVSWHGFHPPAGRWLAATAEADGSGIVHLLLRPTAPDLDGHVDTGRSVPVEADLARDRLAYLAEVSESLIASLDTGETAERLAQLVVPRLADWATVIVLGEHGADDLSGRAHRDPDRLADLDTYLAGRVRGARQMPRLAAALASGEPVLLTAVDRVVTEQDLPTERVREAWRRLNGTSCLFVPLRAHGQTFGALSLIRTGDRPPHTETEIAVAVEVARRGSLALDNTRLYTRQVTVAETLQRSLLADPPPLAGLQIAVRYRPASRHALVGGDFFDVFTQPDGATVLVIGDVAGHNVEAAAAMGRLASTVRTIAYDRAGGPAQTLSRTDRVLTGLGFGTLATALVARLEPAGADRWRLRWSSAGHPPPLLLRPDGTVQVLDTPPERLLGLDEPARRTAHTTLVQPGETVLLVTDGLIEAGHVGIDDGLARLVSALGEAGQLPVEQLCDRLLDSITGGQVDDDIALLAVRRSPTGGPRARSGSPG